MKKVLIGAYRDKGSFKNKKDEEINFDLIRMFVADYRGYAGKDINVHGFIYQLGDDRSPVKAYAIPTNRFEAVTGISPQEFLKRFEARYMFHQLDITVKENDFGKDEIVNIDLSAKDCFIEYKELERKRSETVKDFDDREYEDFDDSENEDSDEGEIATVRVESKAGTELFSFDTSSGEVVEELQPKEAAEKKRGLFGRR